VYYINGHFFPDEPRSADTILGPLLLIFYYQHQSTEKSIETVTLTSGLAGLVFSSSTVGLHCCCYCCYCYQPHRST